MLKRSHTAVLEKNETYSADFDTEPYEAGWAGEARFFLHVLEVQPLESGGEGKMTASVQISPDGLHWCNEGSVLEPITGTGLYSIGVTNFGGWLRLSCRVAGGSAFKLMVYLGLKE